MNNQLHMVRLMLIDLNSDEFYYYPCIIILKKYNRSYSTLEAPFGRICVPNKIEDVNLKMFNRIKGKMNQKQLQNISQVNVEVSLMVEAVTQYK